MNTKPANVNNNVKILEESSSTSSEASSSALGTSNNPSAKSKVSSITRKSAKESASPKKTSPTVSVSDKDVGSRQG